MFHPPGVGILDKNAPAFKQRFVQFPQYPHGDFPGDGAERQGRDDGRDGAVRVFFGQHLAQVDRVPDEKRDLAVPLAERPGKGGRAFHGHNAPGGNPGAEQLPGHGAGAGAEVDDEPLGCRERRVFRRIPGQTDKLAGQRPAAGTDGADLKRRTGEFLDKPHLDSEEVHEPVGGKTALCISGHGIFHTFFRSGHGTLDSAPARFAALCLTVSQQYRKAYMKENNITFLTISQITQHAKDFKFPHAGNIKERTDKHNPMPRACLSIIVYRIYYFTMTARRP
ncbi:hypothetical protein KL86DPRO_50269 [uncultured delta proteobacterium]|uniref:Uncharacterized protein n=1 Tax=uncultured delta proteobacterium TaxID=34034 RepID=A0A212KDI9_9DELT|nr:hypothetical protein KL86DPRO_50269 [uncultured delta proteobacterium]